MTEKNILSALSGIDDKYIKEVETSKMTKTKKWGLGGLAAVACLALMVCVYTQTGTTEVSFDLTDRIVVSETAISGKAMVNIEGVITEVLDDGLSFKLDNGKTVIVEDTTKIGTDATTEAAKEMQFVEPTFRVGNSISGYAEDVEADEIIAYQIYTNWNWENPIT